MIESRKHQLLAICSNEQLKARIQPFVATLGRIGNGGQESIVADNPAEIASIVKPGVADMLIATWCSDTSWMSEVTAIGNWNGLNVACVRIMPIQPRRILVLVSGGPYALKGMSLARDISAAWKIPITILHVMTGRNDHSSIPKQDAMRSIYRRFRMHLDMMGVQAQISVRMASSVARAVQGEAQPSDIILMGGPATWLVSADFIGSIPHSVAKAVTNSLVMITPHRTEPMTLSEVFWTNTIRLDLRAETYFDAIAALADALIEEKQISKDWRDKIIKSALERESCATTSFGCNIGVPHAAITEATGITGCLGIFPSGIHYGETTQSKTHLVFLLVTPKHDYTEYLHILAQIAEVVYDPVRRQSLINSMTADEAAQLLAQAELLSR